MDKKNVYHVTTDLSVLFGKADKRWLCLCTIIILLVQQIVLWSDSTSVVGIKDFVSMPGFCTDYIYMCIDYIDCIRAKHM